MEGSVDRSKLIADVKVVLDDVDSLLRQAATATGQQAIELRERAAESLHRAKQRLQDAQAALGETTRAAVRATDDWVHQHPWSAIGIGAGIGFLIGLLVARR